MYKRESELPKVKAENPSLEHKAAFKLVAERWKNSPENPKVCKKPFPYSIFRHHSNDVIAFVRV
ncbi:10233_t:CDS:2 [Cetraspora pellucida]|uniref:10233_t:CDS:1 n=1 Tax=Cetraspora pellucida TaxID=1433469 RepID=A0A9N9DY57_9GLOM|nr:10233_t:CDS:2 [Cetraspora pellucida]